jgi:hypothetical protein
MWPLKWKCLDKVLCAMTILINRRNCHVVWLLLLADRRGEGDDQVLLETNERREVIPV